MRITYILMIMMIISFNNLFLCLFLNWSSNFLWNFQLQIFKDIDTTKPAVVPLKANHAAITSLAYCNASYVAAITYDNMCVALWQSPMDVKGGKDGYVCRDMSSTCIYMNVGSLLIEFKMYSEALHYRSMTCTQAVERLKHLYYKYAIIDVCDSFQ